MKARARGDASPSGGTVVPFPARRSARDRLTESDLNDLFARWLRGDVLNVETAVSSDFNCFLATGKDGDCHFLFWREADGQYVSEDTRTGRRVTGATLGDVLPSSALQS